MDGASGSLKKINLKKKFNPPLAHSSREIYASRRSANDPFCQREYCPPLDHSRRNIVHKPIASIPVAADYWPGSARSHAV